MKIDLHLIIYKAAQIKFNVNSGSIMQENDIFTLTSDDGRIFTNEDFSKEELSAAKIELESEEQLRINEYTAKKSELLNRLGITAEEAQLLLGGN